MLVQRTVDLRVGYLHDSNIEAVLSSITSFITDSEHYEYELITLFYYLYVRKKARFAEKYFAFEHAQNESLIIYIFLLQLLCFASKKNK